jgi:hypothetical protein
MRVQHDNLNKTLCLFNIGDSLPGAPSPLHWSSLEMIYAFEPPSICPS